MALPISTMIGIRTGGVFSGSVDTDDIKTRIINLLENNDDDIYFPHIELLNTCMSNELDGDKGSYVIIAGVFNYWGQSRTFNFARQLSKEFGTEIMVMTWNEMSDEYGCNIFLDGEPLNEVEEHSISKIIRRVV